MVVNLVKEMALEEMAILDVSDSMFERVLY
jgi:hypothetical protein